jgi:hypothetical protein
MKHAVRHQLSAMQKVIDSAGSTPSEVAGARAELRKIQGEPTPQPAALIETDGFTPDPYFEEVLSGGTFLRLSLP